MEEVTDIQPLQTSIVNAKEREIIRNIDEKWVEKPRENSAISGRNPGRNYYFKKVVILEKKKKLSLN